MRRKLATLLAASTAATAVVAAPAAPAAADVPACPVNHPTEAPALATPVTYRVAVAPGTEFDVHLWRWRLGPTGKDVVLVHGFGHNARFWEQTVAHLGGRFPGAIRNVYALDLPAAGNSGWAGNHFHVSQSQYVEAVTATLDRLREDLGNPIDVLGGHSMGALVVQEVQESLLGGGGSVTSRWGVTDVVLVAPVIPEETPWRFAETPFPSLFDLLGTIRIQLFAPYGLHSCSDDVDFERLFFANRSGSIVTPESERPTSDELKNLRSEQPITAGLEALALFGGERPHVRFGAFAESRGVDLTTIAYRHDYFFADSPGDPWYEEHALHNHLRGVFPNAPQFAAVGGNRAIHDAPWSAPDIADQGWAWALT